MACKVKVSKYQLNCFRRLARSTNKEVEACLVGKVVSAQLIVIHRFVYTKKYEKQTTNTVKWFDREFEDLKVEAGDQQLALLGTIHSHPNFWPVVSPADHLALVADQMRVTGICATMKGKTVVYFWVAESCLPCKIEYAKSKKTQRTATKNNRAIGQPSTVLEPASKADLVNG